MGKKILAFGEKCIIKNSFHQNKKPISIDKVDVRRIMLPKKDSYGFILIFYWIYTRR